MAAKPAVRRADSAWFLARDLVGGTCGPRRPVRSRLHPRPANSAAANCAPGLDSGMTSGKAV